MFQTGHRAPDSRFLEILKTFLININFKNLCLLVFDFLLCFALFL